MNTALCVWLVFSVGLVVWWCWLFYNSPNSKPKVRIVKRTREDSIVVYVIQKKWFGIWRDVLGGEGSWTCEYHSLEVAKSHLCYYDGTKSNDVVVYEGE